MIDRTSCTCSSCCGRCHRRPGFATPGEIRALIDAGHGAALMVEWWRPDWVPDSEPAAELLAVAVEGRESNVAAIHPVGRCTFLDADERCSVYELRPVECAFTRAPA